MPGHTLFSFCGPALAINTGQTKKKDAGTSFVLNVYEQPNKLYWTNYLDFFKPSNMFVKEEVARDIVALPVTAAPEADKGRCNEETTGICLRKPSTQKGNVLNDYLTYCEACLIEHCLLVTNDHKL